jgi:hypothetical protein
VSERSPEMPDGYDRLLGALHGLPDEIHTKPAPLRVIAPLGVGGSKTYIVQTYRQRERGDTVFLEIVGPDGAAIRIALPPEVSNTIARQRDSLTSRSRSRTAKRVAQERKDRGEEPAFRRPRTAEG